MGKSRRSVASHPAHYRRVALADVLTNVTADNKLNDSQLTIAVMQEANEAMASQ